MKPSGFFVLRTPLLPFSTWTSLGAEVEAARALGTPDLAAAVQRDLAPAAETPRVAWGAKETLLLQKLQACAATGDVTVDLSEADIAAMAPARSPEGSFTHEVVVPMHNEAKTEPRLAMAFSSLAQRSLLPGSECLYVKIYTGHATLDRVLSQLIAKVVAVDSERRWFFIRYGDPDWHLRLRLFGDATRLLPVLHREIAALQKQNLVWRIVRIYQSQSARLRSGQ